MKSLQSIGPSEVVLSSTPLRIATSKAPIASVATTIAQSWTSQCSRQYRPLYSFVRVCCITHLFSTVVTPSRYLHNHHHNLVFSASLTHILFFGQHKKKDASKTQNKSNPIIVRLFWPSLLLGRFCCRASHNCVTWERTSGVLPSFSFHAQVKRIFRFFFPPQ